MKDAKYLVQTFNKIDSTDGDYTLKVIGKYDLFKMLDERKDAIVVNELGKTLIDWS